MAQDYVHDCLITLRVYFTYENLLKFGTLIQGRVVNHWNYTLKQRYMFIGWHLRLQEQGDFSTFSHQILSSSLPIFSLYYIILKSCSLRYFQGIGPLSEEQGFNGWILNIGDRDIDVVVDLLNSQVKGDFAKHCALIIHLTLVSFFFHCMVSSREIYWQRYSKGE